MKTSYLLLAAGLLLGAAMVAKSPGPSAVDAAQPTASANQSGAEILDVRYAQAFLKLAQADLRKAQDANERVPGTVPDSLLQPLAANVIVAKQRLARAEHPDDRKVNPYVNSAEAMLQSAQDNWKKALAVNQREAGTVRQTEIDRLQALTELARVRLEQARALDTGSPLARATFDLEQLRLEVHRLYLEVSRLRDRN